MTTIQTYVTVVILSLVIGFGAGYLTSHKFDLAKQAIALKAQVAADTVAADKRLAAEQKVADAVRQQMVQAQLATTSLNAQLDDLQKANASLTDKIAHVHFIAAPRPAVANSCPGSVIDSTQFMQLYDAAAGGGAGPSTDAGHASGMLEIPHAELPRSIDWPSIRLLFDDRGRTGTRAARQQEERYLQLSTTA